MNFPKRAWLNFFCMLFLCFFHSVATVRAMEGYWVNSMKAGKDSGEGNLGFEELGTKPCGILEEKKFARREAKKELNPEERRSNVHNLEHEKLNLTPPENLEEIGEYWKIRRNSCSQRPNPPKELSSSPEKLKTLGGVRVRENYLKT